MKRLVLVLPIALVSACSKTPDSALSARVHVAPALKADCLELAVFAGGSQRKSLLLERTAMKEEWVVGVRRGDDLPETVSFQARAYLGTCSDASTLKLNSRSVEVQATFPKQGVTNVQLLQLDPPDPTLDGDRDGFVSAAQGGADCDDVSPTTFPGSVQLCSSEADTDCDGVVACGDSECASSAECVDPPDRLSLTNVPLTLPRTRCGGPVTVGLRNALGPRGAGLTTTVQLASSLAGVGFFADQDCTVPVTSVTIPFQQDSATVYLRGDVAGSAVLTASSGSLTPATSDIVIAPLPATQLVFTSPPRSLPAGGCLNNEMTVELRDADNRPTTVTSDLAVTLNASPEDAEGNFSVTADCSPASATTIATIPAGRGSVTFRVFSRRATAPGAPMRVTAQVDVGLPSPLVATQDVTISAAAPSKLAFRNQPLVIQSGQACSSTPGDVRLQVQVQDQFGNPSPAAQAWALSFTGPTGVTFHDATTGNCNTPITTLPLPAGTTEVDLFLKGTTPTSGLVTVSEVTGGLASASQNLIVSAGSPTRVVWDMNPRSAQANQCTASPLTLGAYDAGNAPASFAMAVQVSLTAVPAVPGLAFYTQPGCPPASQVTGTTTFPAGAAQIQLYFKGTTAASAFTVRATPMMAGIAGSDLAGNSIVAGPPASLRFSPTTQTVQVGNCAGPFAVSIFDAFNNPAAFGVASDLTFNPMSAGTYTWGTSSSSCGGSSPISIPAGMTSAQVYFGSTIARGYTLTGTAGGVSTSNTAALTFTPGPSMGLSVFEPASQTQTLVAGSCLLVTLERKDTYGNDVPVGSATTLTFPMVPTGVTFHANLSACQTKTGAVTSFGLMATESRKSFYVRVERVLSSAPLVARLLSQDATLTLTVTPAAAASIAFVGLPTSRQSGVCSGAVNLTRKDAFGNDATADGPLPATVSGAGVTFFPSADCSGPGGTSVSADFAANSATSATVSMSSPVVGTYPVLATAGGFSDTKDFTVTVGAASKVVLTGAGGALAAGACVDQTAEVRDANDNLVAGNHTITLSAAPTAGVTFYEQAGCTGGAITSKVTGGTASAGFSFRVTAPAASLVVTASSGSLTAGTATYSVTPGPPTAVGLTLATNVATAGDCVNASAEVRDAYNNPVPGARTIDLSASPATGVTFYDAANCGGMPTTEVSIVTGASVAFSLRVTKAVPAQDVTAASTGLVSGVETLAVSAGAATKVVIPTAGATVNAGTCVDANAEVRDAYDNLVTGARTIDLSAAPPTGVTFYGMAACGGGAITSKSTSGGSSIAFSFRANTPTSSLVVTAATSGLTAGTQTWVIALGPPAKLAWKTAPPATLARFTCSGAVTVELRDAGDNTANATTDTVVTLNTSAAGAGLSFFSDMACTTAVPTVTITTGTSEATFYVAVTGSSMTNVTGTSGTLTATPPAPVTPSGTVTDVLVVAAATPDVEPGGCVPLTVTRQTSGGAPITMGVSSFSVASSNAAINFYTSPTCSGTAAGTGTGTIANGSSTGLVYAHGKSVASVTPVTLTASDPNSGLLQGTTMVNAYPLVRRGTCDIADGSLDNRCVLSPAIPNHDINRSFLVFSASGNTRHNPGGGFVVAPTDSNVECHLEATGTDTAVKCTRGDSHQQVSVNYQVVSWGRDFASGGVSVRHLTGTLAANATTADLSITPALSSPGSAFLLFSTSSAAGTLNGEAHFPTARILDVNTVRLARADAAGPAVNYAVEVVEFAGVTTERGVATNRSGATFSVGVSAAPSNHSFLLYSARTDAATANDQYICKRRLKVRHGSSTRLDFSRGAGGGGAGSNCTNSNVVELAWERVTLPSCGFSCSPVQHPNDITLNDTVPSGTQNLTSAVETHRAIVFMAGQGPGGQAAGEGNFNDSDADTGDNTAALHGRATFNSATQVRVERALATDKAVFAPQVVQFDP
ncbi:MAG: hypothetical protein AB1730_07430 [Myxococcota bacterium]|jgi:hypothetical protein